MDKQHLEVIQEAIEDGEYILQAWKDARQQALGMSLHWKDNAEVQESVRQYMVLNKAEITLAEIKLDEYKEQLATLRKQKVITLSPQLYSSLIRFVHDERDDIGCQLNSGDYLLDRENMKQQYSDLCDLSEIIFEQCE